MTNGEPDYVLDPFFLSFLDSAVTWAEELHVNLLLDNHTFDPGIETDPSIENSLIKVWTQMTEHYKNRSEYIFYEE
jgi:endoglucanase